MKHFTSHVSFPIYFHYNLVTVPLLMFTEPLSSLVVIYKTHRRTVISRSGIMSLSWGHLSGQGDWRL